MKFPNSEVFIDIKYEFIYLVIDLWQGYTHFGLNH